MKSCNLSINQGNLVELRKHEELKAFKKSQIMIENVLTW